ncbi:glycosyltransferase [Bacillus sp. SCS-153A]|uniref:glycosyltransferase family 4 protein n=1 Tax=Rossellomorea sedimentorum TaxID=3115294 RepID=UPI0039069953
MEKVSVLILSNTVSLFPSDIKQSPEHMYQLMSECLGVMKKGQEYPGIAYVVNPLVIDWLSEDAAKGHIEQFFMTSMQESRKGDNRNIEELYSAWMNIHRDIPTALNMLQEQGSLTIIPSTVVNFPVTHLITGWGIHLLLQQSIQLYNQHFQKAAKGFWLPKCAYTPGIDLFLMKHGIQYSFISRSTFEYSEKDEVTASVLRTPRGMRLIPVNLQTNKHHIVVNGDGVEGLDQYIVNLQNNGFKLQPFNEENHLTERGALTRAGFGFMGMEQGEVILPDKALVHMRELHMMETTLKDLTSSTSHDSKVLQQLIREWISSLHHLQAKHELNSTSLQAFRELSQLKSELDNSHLLQYRESLEYLPIELPEKSAGEETPSSTKQQTVLLLSWEYPPNIVGGLSRHVHDLSKSLVKKGCKVIVLTASTDSVPDYEVDEGVHVYRTGPLHPMEEDFLHWVFQLNLSFIDKASEIMAKEQIDLIHAHDWIVGKSAAMLKDHYGVPLVTTLHATEYGRNQGIFTNLQQRIHEEERRLVAASNQVILCSDHMKEELAQLEPRKNLAVSIIPNGVNLQNVSQDNYGPIRESLEGKKYYFSIGRVVHEKGFETIIETAERINKEREIHFVIAGKGPLLEQYRLQVKEKGLEEFVHFLGFVSDSERNALLFQSEAVIFPSIYEPFGIVALEAMAAGKAVIASKTGGLKSLVEHGYAGLLFEPGNAESLKSCLMNLEETCGLKKSMGENGYKVAEMMFSWERISKQTLEVYEELTLQHKVEGASL